MLKKKEQWVGAYTSKILHFGATTTQRVEGAHAFMKAEIRSAGSINNAMEKIDLCIRQQVKNGHNMAL